MDPLERIEEPGVAPMEVVEHIPLPCKSFSPFDGAVFNRYFTMSVQVRDVHDRVSALMAQLQEKNRLLALAEPEAKVCELQLQLEPVEASSQSC